MKNPHIQPARSPLFLLLIGLLLPMTSCLGQKGPPPCGEPGGRPGVQVWTGDAMGADIKGTRDKAFANALNEGLSPLGVRVKGDVKIQQRTETTRDASGRVVTTARDMAESNAIIKLDEVEVRNFKVEYCTPPDKDDTIRAVVRLPGSEFARISRMKKGRTLMVVDCKSEPDGACDNSVVAGLRKAADAAKLDVADVIKPPEGVDSKNGEQMVMLGANKAAAYVLWVQLQGTFKAKQDDVLFAFSEAAAFMSETSDGKSLRSLALDGPVKGAVYEQVGAQKNTEVDAVRDSLRKAAGELADQIRWWKKPAP